MGKRSQSGCMRNLFSVFRRLLSNRKRKSGQSAGDNLEKTWDECQTVTSHRPTLKQLMDEERLNEEEAKKQMLNDKDCEIDSKRGDKIGKLRACEMGMEHECLSYPDQRVPTIYTEAKKHLSEMLSNGDEQSDSFPESSDEVELLSVSHDPKQQEEEEGEEDPKFKSQKNMPDSFSESSDEIELLRDDPNLKQEEEGEEEDPKFKLQKKLSDSFLESSSEIPSVSVDPDPKQEEEEEEGEEEDPKLKLLKILPDSIFQKKLMELLDNTFFCL